MLYIQANTNGRLHPATEPSLPPLNRSFLYGDAIYEVWRTYDGVLFAWEEHWRRLGRSAAALCLTLPFSADELFAEIRRTAAAFLDREKSAHELYVRVQVSRGCGPIGLDTELAGSPDFVILVQENREHSAGKLQAGLRLEIAGLRRNPPEALNPAWKTGNYLNNILCLREARASGADEVVITNLAGEIAEAAVSNIAFVRAGTVVTPPLSAGILAGITRELLIREVAPAAGIPVVEESIQPDRLAGMQECFLLSSTKDLTPVAAIGDWSFSVGPVVFQLKRAFRDWAAGQARLHPERRLRE